VVNVQGPEVHGKLLVEQASKNSPVKIRGVIYGLPSGQHGLHIHTGTELGHKCERVGAPFNPTDKPEGERPVGYLGNVKVI
jgi:Cu/Zn superoxide dismutase